jgi:hypothetical protein
VLEERRRVAFESSHFDKVIERKKHL